MPHNLGCGIKNYENQTEKNFLRRLKKRSKKYFKTILEMKKELKLIDNVDSAFGLSLNIWEIV